MIDVKGKTILDLSKMGDPLANLIYSLALYKVNKRPFGKKVSNQILSEALVRSGLRDGAGSRMNKKDLGNHVEGLIFKAWAAGDLEIEAAAGVIAAALSPGSKGRELRDESIEGFSLLLRGIKGP